MKATGNLTAVLTAIAITAAACGGAASPPETTASTGTPTTAAPTTTTVPSVTTAREGATFLRLVEPYNTEIAKFTASAVKPSTTAALRAYLAPLVAASNTLVSGLIGTAFSGQAASSTRTLAIGAEAVVADVQSVTVSNWASEKVVIDHDMATVKGEENVVRADLDLHAMP